MERVLQGQKSRKDVFDDPPVTQLYQGSQLISTGEIIPFEASKFEGVFQHNLIVKQSFSASTLRGEFGTI